MSQDLQTEKMQDGDIISLGYGEWPLRSKKKGTQTWTMGHETNSSSCIEI